MLSDSGGRGLDIAWRAARPAWLRLVSKAMPQFSKPFFIPSRRLLAAAVTGLLLLSFCPLSAAEEAYNPRGDVPTADEVNNQLKVLRDRRADLETDLEVQQEKLSRTIENLDRSDSAHQRLALEIERLRESTRDIAVSVFVIGGSGLGMGYLLDVGGTSDLRWRKHLLDGTLAAPVHDNSARLKELEAQVGADLMEVVARIADIRLEIRLIGSQIAAVDEAIADSLDLFVVAEAWDRADIAIAKGVYGLAPLEKWLALRFCESSDDYQAVSPTGRYRGAYQFDLPTWRSVGGSGDPIYASPGEQDARARELYALRGSDPWPVCGRRHLR